MTDATTTKAKPRGEAATFHMTRLVYAKPVAAAVVAGAATLSMLGVVRRSGWQVDFDPTLPLLCVATAFVAWAGLTWLQWNSVELTVDRSRLVYKTGVLGNRVTTVSLSQVVGVNVDQTFSERMIGAGTIDIETTGTERIICRNMRNAPGIGALVNDLKEAGRGT